MKHFRWTSDESAPCVLCVSWVKPADSEALDIEVAESIPVDGQGNPIPRVYTGMHYECDRAVREAEPRTA